MLEVLQGTVATFILCCGYGQRAGKFEQGMDVGEVIGIALLQGSNWRVWQGHNTIPLPAPLPNISRESCGIRKICSINLSQLCDFGCGILLFNQDFRHLTQHL